MNIFMIMTLILALPAAGSILVFLFGKNKGFFSSGIWAAVFSFLTLAVSVALLAYPPFDKTVTLSCAWINLIGIRGGIYCDALSLTAIVTSCAVAFLALIFSLGYYKDDKEFNSKAYYSLVLLFLTGLIGVFLSSDLILFYLFWEMMLLPTFAFVAYFGEDKKRSFAIAIKYFIFTHIGAVLLLFAFLMLYAMTGTTDMLSIRVLLHSLNVFPLKVVALLLFFGFAVKLAIFPMHSWLPEAYANAPYPAVVLMSAVMMNAGIYGIIRFIF